MRTLGRVTNVYFERYGSGLSREALTGATSIWVDSNVDFDEDGGTCDIEGEEYTYTLGADGDTEDELIISPPLTADFLEGTPVSTSPVTQVKMADVAPSDDNAIDGEDLVCVVDHALTAMLVDGIREHGRGETVEVSDESGILKVISMIGEEGKLLADNLEIGEKEDPLSDNLPPAYSPLPTTLPSLKQVFVRWEPVPNHDLVTYEVHVASTADAPLPTAGDPATLVMETGSTMVAIRSLPNGDPMVYLEPDGDIQEYYFSILARDVDGPAEASAWVAGNMDLTGTDDIVTGAVTTALLDAVLAVVGVLRIGGDLIELSPPTNEGGELRGGIIVKDRANLSGEPLIQLHPDGCRIKADLTTDFVAVLQGLVLNGNMQILNGNIIMLEDGVPTPALPPGVGTDTGIMGNWPMNGHASDLTSETATIDPWQKAAGGVRIGFLEILSDGVSLYGRYLNFLDITDGRVNYDATELFFIGQYANGIEAMSVANRAGGGYRGYVAYRTGGTGTVPPQYKIDEYSWGNGVDPDNPEPAFLRTLNVSMLEGDVKTPKTGVAKYERSAVMDFSPDGSQMAVAWVHNLGAANAPYTGAMSVYNIAGENFTLHRGGPINLVESTPGVRRLVGLHWYEAGTWEVVGAIAPSVSAPTGTAVWALLQPPASTGMGWPKKAGTGFGRTPSAPQYTLKAQVENIMFSRDYGNTPTVRQWTNYIPPEVAETAVACYTDTVGLQHTAASPISDPVQLQYRSSLRVAAAAAPPEITGKQIYFKKSSDGIWKNWPEGWEHRTTSFDPSRTEVIIVADPPSTSDIPDSEASHLRTRSGGFELNGDGTGDWPLVLDPLRDRLDDLEVVDPSYMSGGITVSAGITTNGWFLVPGTPSGLTTDDEADPTEIFQAIPGGFRIKKPGIYEVEASVNFSVGVDNVRAGASFITGGAGLVVPSRAAGGTPLGGPVQGMAGTASPWYPVKQTFRVISGPVDITLEAFFQSVTSRTVTVGLYTVIRK